MTTNRIDRIAGMQDVGPDAYERRGETADKIRSFLASKGYAPIDTPVIEDAELLVRKSGGEFVSRMYTFTDPGGRRVSLRPEFTSSVIRYFIEESESLDLPVRVQYGGPVFRYEQARDDAYRQFTQVGAELIGATGADADAEVLSTAWAALEAAGVEEYRVRVGHIGVLQSFLSGFQLSEPARLFVIGNVNGLRNGDTDTPGLVEQARSVGLLASEASQIGDEPPAVADDAAARDFVRAVLAGGVSGPVGRRTSEEIVERLLQKAGQGSQPERIEEALNLAAKLARLNGEATQVLTKARDLAAGNAAAAAAVDELESLFKALTTQGIDRDRLELDLGLARGLSYYTGVIFDFVAGKEDTVLGGGGRYDALVRALGGEHTPALGFAYTLERVVEAVTTSMSAPVAE